MGTVEQISAIDGKVLKERARHLALPLNKTVGEQLYVLQFISQNRVYALEGAFINEVAPLGQMTPLPGVPSFVLGVVNLHGRIVALLDLQSILGVAEPEASSANNIIVLQGVASEFGFLADVIIGFVSIPIADLQIPLPPSASSGVSYVESMTIDGVTLLGAEKLLLDISLIVKEYVGSGL